MMYPNFDLRTVCFQRCPLLSTIASTSLSRVTHSLLNVEKRFHNYYFYAVIHRAYLCVAPRYSQGYDYV